MSVAPPPSENLPIFNPDVFELDDSNISLSQADARYYKKTGGVISGSATIAGTTNLLSTTNISGVVNISNSTQSTAPTNGALVVSGGLGIARNSHFNGTIHAPVGSAAAPTFSFISNPNTGIFQNGSNVLGIAANGTLRVSHSATTSIINNVLSLPTTGSATAAALNFGTVNTGLFSSSANSLNLTVAGTQRLDITGTRFAYNLPIQLSVGAQTAPQIYFSTSTQTGFYLPNTNEIGITVAGTLRQQINATRMITNIPIRLPNDGVNFSDFNYYEVFSQTMIMRYSATQTFNWVVNLVRIGQNTTYYFGDDANLYTINNGPRAIQSETNTIPSRFRVGTNQATPYIYLTGGLVWTVGKILINSDGTISITPLNGNFNNGDTIYIQRHSTSVYI